MDLQAAIIARLQVLVPQLRQIEGAIELDAALSSDAHARIDTPAAFVVPLSDMPSDDESFSGQTIQQVVGSVAIVFCLDSYRDELGQAAAADLNALRVAVRRALLGWVADPDTGEPVRAGKGQLLDFGGGRTWWADEYDITYYWSEEP